MSTGKRGTFWSPLLPFLNPQRQNSLAKHARSSFGTDPGVRGNDPLHWFSERTVKEGACGIDLLSSVCRR